MEKRDPLYTCDGKANGHYRMSCIMQLPQGKIKQAFDAGFPILGINLKAMNPCPDVVSVLLCSLRLKHSSVHVADYPAQCPLLLLFADRLKPEHFSVPNLFHSTATCSTSHSSDTGSPEDRLITPLPRALPSSPPAEILSTIQGLLRHHFTSPFPTLPVYRVASFRNQFEAL